MSIVRSFTLSVKMALAAIASLGKGTGPSEFALHSSFFHIGVTDTYMYKNVSIAHLAITLAIDPERTK